MTELEINKKVGFEIENGVIISGPWQIYSKEREYSWTEEEPEFIPGPGNWVRVYFNVDDYHNNNTITFRFVCGQDFDLSWVPEAEEYHYEWQTGGADEAQTLLYIGDDTEPTPYETVSWGGELNWSTHTYQGDPSVVFSEFVVGDIPGMDSFTFESNEQRELLGNTCEFNSWK